jgi:transcriptional regulator with XRE-family HTH domain
MTSRDLGTPADRIRWAVEQSGHTLPEIAADIGCSHSALSQWQTGATTVDNIKAGLLLRFCEFTGASIQWLLTGDGPRLAGYARPKDEAPLLTLAQHIVRDLDPITVATAERLLRALEPGAE